MKIISPCVEFEASYKAYMKELGDEERYPYPLDLDETNFAALVCRLEGYTKGIALPNGLVPNSSYWLVQEREILGCSHLRHELNDELRRAGGHIGLGIRPKARGKGLSKELLRLTLAKAKDMGINQVHVHCYEENMQSRRMIESMNAQLDSIIDVPTQRVMRYLINNAALK